MVMKPGHCVEHDRSGVEDHVSFMDVLGLDAMLRVFGIGTSKWPRGQCITYLELTEY